MRAPFLLAASPRSLTMKSKPITRSDLRTLADRIESLRLDSLRQLDSKPKRDRAERQLEALMRSEAKLIVRSLFLAADQIVGD